MSNGIAEAFMGIVSVIAFLIVLPILEKGSIVFDQAVVAMVITVGVISAVGVLAVVLNRD